MLRRAQELVFKLYEIQNKKQVNLEIKEKIINLLEENDLTTENNIPDWFINFLKFVLERKESEKIYFTDNKNKGDIYNFLAELEEIIEGDWNDYGEAIEVFFDKLGIKAIISLESHYFQILYEKLVL